MGVNNLPRVVAWRCTGRELNPGPLGLESNTLTTTPPSHPSGVVDFRCCRNASTAWEYFHNNITQYELYRNSTRQPYVDQLLKNMETLPIADVEEMPKKGTQIKLILTLDDETKILFKPMR